MAVATFENERRKQGIAAAKTAGKYAGRKTLITAEVQDLKETKNLSITQIANEAEILFIKF
jgi:DNA invertase Pin-like site-specific DNA recombinase